MPTTKASRLWPLWLNFCNNTYIYQYVVYCDVEQNTGLKHKDINVVPDVTNIFA